MTLRLPAFARPARAALVAALLLGLVGVGTAAAQEPITVAARALVGGRFQPGGWVALEVTLSNSGPPVTGYLTAAGDGGNVQRFVELPSGSRKTVPLYVRPQAFARQLRVRLVSVEGGELATVNAPVRSIDAGGRAIGVVGDPDAHLRPQLSTGEDAGGGLETILALTASDLPERPEPLGALNAIVWAADSAGLTEAQRRSMEWWVASGGQLVVLGGPDWQARTGAFAELLPVTNLESVDGVPLSSLAEWAGDEPLDASLTASLGTLREEARALIPLGAEAGDRAGAPLVSALTVGSGRVTFIAADMATQQFRGWAGSNVLWARLVPDHSALTQFLGVPGFDPSFSAFVSALGSIPALQVPPAELLLIVIVGYILLIGPISYLVLRRLDRREMAWVTSPALVVLFSLGSYGIGNAMKGGEIILNEFSVVRTATPGTAASVHTYAGLFSPSRASYDLTVRGDALVTALGSGEFDFQGLPVMPDAVVEQGDPAHLRQLEVNVFGLQAVRAEAVVEYTPALEVEWHFIPDGVAGTVRNMGREPLEDVAVIAAGGGSLIDDLAPGASADFELRLGNFDGTPPSQRVYGFDDGSGATEDAERLRRQVIDGLVGYGGGGPVPLDLGAPAVFTTGGGGAGPYVVGWRAVEGPVRFDVDGRRVNRHSQTVEVFSTRPAYLPGPVEIRPARLTTSVVDIQGEVDQAPPGGVLPQDGHADLAIALPLELARLEPTRIELVVGSDMFMLIAPEQFGFFPGQGLFPPGYRLAVRDVESGTWLDLGDLAQDTQFDVDNPVRYLDATGTITVRVSGAGGGPGVDFGQPPIFVSAEIDGVLP